MRAKYYLCKLTKYPPHITVYKILYKVYVWIKIRSESIKVKIFSACISDVEFLNSLDEYFKSTGELLKHLKERKFPRFFNDPTESSGIVDLIKSHHSDSLKQTIANADKVCEHVFDLLGSGPTHLGDKIDWHTDFKVNWTWKREYFKLVDYSDLDEPYDVKVPWELSRCQHFVTLGKAYWYTKDEKYASEFVEQVSDWIESNPPKLGVNWVCTMDVAIRVVNWVWGYYFFKDSPSLTDDFLVRFLKSLLIHNRHIMSNLENKEKITGNHYLSNIVGLVYLGVIFPEFREARQWRTFGIQELIREMEKQVYPDGVDYEGSISYHRLVAELFLSATLLVLLNEQNNVPVLQPSKASNLFPEWYMRRLEKIIEFVLYYMKPDGTAPQIGDNDDGRLHILSNYGNWNRLDHRYLLSVGAVLFGRFDFKEGSGYFHEEALWLLGEDGLSRYNSLRTESAKPESRAFSQGGFYIMRHRDLYMIVDCINDDPQAPLGHRHNSRLSFELFAYGKSFIIDPGAYIYTADSKWRNIFRSTAYHNTALVDSQEQTEFDPSVLFWLGKQAEVKVIKWHNSDECDLLDAEHSGYERLADPVTHRRQILFNKSEGFWLIRDMLTSNVRRQSPRTYELELNLHFAPVEIAIDPEEPFSVIATDRDNIGLRVIPVTTSGLEPPKIEKSWVSYSYGVKIEATVVKYRKLARSPVEFMILLHPCTEGQSRGDFRKIQMTASIFMEGKF